MEHEEQAERMEEDAERMDERGDQLDARIDDIQADWERKEQDPAVPGAQPDAAEDEEPVAGVNTDEDVVSEEGGP